jgi:hypothetical protein
MTLTPAVREFLVRLDELFDARESAWLGLDRDAISVTSADATTLVRLPHRHDHTLDVELQVDDRAVLVRYAPEAVSFTSRGEALRFIEMLGDGRVVLALQRGPLWTTMRSYRDGLALPFRRTRMPWPRIPPKTERRPFGFA